MCFPENHTALNISEKVEEILANFCVDCQCDRVVAVVHDQGSNLKAFSCLIKAEFGW